MRTKLFVASLSVVGIRALHTRACLGAGLTLIDKFEGNLWIISVDRLLLGNREIYSFRPCLQIETWEANISFKVSFICWYCFLSILSGSVGFMSPVQSNLPTFHPTYEWTINAWSVFLLFFIISERFALEWVGLSKCMTFHSMEMKPLTKP